MAINPAEELGIPAPATGFVLTFADMAVLPDDLLAELRLAASEN